MLRVALGKQLSGCPLVKTLGVRPNLSDYDPGELEILLGAERIYFPTSLYADALHAIGKEIFPSIQTYRYVGDKIKQAILFDLLGIPMPKTRVYYGSAQHQRILEDFDPPFVAKLPRGSSMGEGVFLIRQREDLRHYLDKTFVAYIQQLIRIQRDLRVIIVGKKVVLAYWRVASSGEFRTNIARGGSVEFGGVPEGALEFAMDVATRCGFDHVGLDICENEGGFCLLEANMVFGRVALNKAGISYRGLLRSMVEKGEI
jgi:ribosomal protein S6--L-glutamate ligase